MSLMTKNDAPIPWTEQAKLRALETYAQVVPVARKRRPDGQAGR